MAKLVPFWWKLEFFALWTESRVLSVLFAYTNFAYFFSRFGNIFNTIKILTKYATFQRKVKPLKNDYFLLFPYHKIAWKILFLLSFTPLLRHIWNFYIFLCFPKEKINGDFRRYELSSTFPFVSTYYYFKSSDRLTIDDSGTNSSYGED